MPHGRPSWSATPCSCRCCTRGCARATAAAGRHWPRGTTRWRRVSPAMRRAYKAMRCHGRRCLQSLATATRATRGTTASLWTSALSWVPAPRARKSGSSTRMDTQAWAPPPRPRQRAASSTIAQPSWPTCRRRRRRACRARPARRRRRSRCARRRCWTGRPRLAAPRPRWRRWRRTWTPACACRATWAASRRTATTQRCGSSADGGNRGAARGVVAQKWGKVAMWEGRQPHLILRFVVFIAPAVTLRSRRSSSTVIGHCVSTLRAPQLPPQRLEVPLLPGCVPGS
mmetsp:Transcript_21892/g.55118  ORF Transcript_21892/g.55118 Transcript_21892/m.55118 type:complete len:285 (+) Transcript_21892:579-1433(+)